MSKSFCKRLGVGLVALAVPLLMVTPVAAQPHPEEVAHVSVECILGLGIDISTCAGAVAEGVIDLHEGMVNDELAAEGVPFVVDIGEPEGAEPSDFPVDVQDIAVNPLPPSVTEGNPPVPGIVYP